MHGPMVRTICSHSCNVKTASALHFMTTQRSDTDCGAKYSGSVRRGTDAIDGKWWTDRRTDERGATISG